MRLLPRLAPCLLLLPLLVTAGCQQAVKDERTVAVDQFDIRSAIYSPARDQQVTVEVSSPGAPVNVYVVLEKDRAAVEKSLGDNKKPANVLASKEKVEQATLEVPIQAKNDFAVVLNGASGKTAQVKLKVTGR
jgi:hypothetical protein